MADLSDSGAVGNVAFDAGVVGTAVADGDLSVETVFRQQWKPLLRLATMLTGSSQVGEELAQEAFARWYVRRQSVEQVVRCESALFSNRSRASTHIAARRDARHDRCAPGTATSRHHAAFLRRGL